MHFELLPSWVLAGLIAVAVASILSLLWARHRSRRRRKRSLQRRLKNMAYAHAWKMVMGRRVPRLTDQRSATE